MEDDLVRVESAVSATASGNLTWEKWPHDVATALGFAGRRNPLGFSVVRWLSDANPSSAWGLVLQLATDIMKRNPDLERDPAYQAAWKAFEFWRDARCTRCQGRGVINREQAKCQSCDGTGQRKAPSGNDAVKDCISMLIEAERWMEGQLRSKLKQGC